MAGTTDLDSQPSSALRKAWPDKEYAVHAMDPLAEQDKDASLPSLGANAKSLWTHELEALLETGEVDLLVHSLKDMPTQLPPGLKIGAILPREDPRNALVVSPRLSSTHHSLASLPAGSTIGTSSLRRSAQLRRLYPHLSFADVRGNVGTRLGKLDNPDSPFVALILAAAGLKRLGMGHRITSFLSKEESGMLHAVGQGALGIEIRDGDEETQRLLEPILCERTRVCLAERSLMRTLEGGCSVPIGVETEWVRKRGVADGTEEEEELTDELDMGAIVVSLNGEEAVVAEIRRRIGSREDADEFGREIARVLIGKGAAKILQEINLHRNIVQAQGNA